MKRASLLITSEALNELLGLKPDISIATLYYDNRTGAFRIHLRGEGLPDFTNVQELEPSYELIPQEAEAYIFKPRTPKDDTTSDVATNPQPGDCAAKSEMIWRKVTARNGDWIEYIQNAPGRPEEGMCKISAWTEWCKGCRFIRDNPSIEDTMRRLAYAADAFTCGNTKSAFTRPFLPVTMEQIRELDEALKAAWEVLGR